jgi:hypothetical protein
MTIQGVIGIFAGLLAFSAIPIYIVDILRGNTKPSRVTWWVLALLNVVITASYFVSGARDTIWIPFAYAVGYVFVAVLSLKYGEGTWGRTDIICLLFALISIGSWWLFRSAYVALGMLIVADFIALVPTFYKAYVRPWTESKLSWGIATGASLLNLFALESWAAHLSLYPLYILITNAVIFVCIFFSNHLRRV